MADQDDDSGVSALRAVAHPVRLQMLSLLTGVEMSAAEVARELGLTHANASYHLRRLLAAGELVEAGEERIRGGVAKRYRYAHQRPEDPSGARPSERPSVDDQVRYVRAIAVELERRVRQRATHRPEDPLQRGLSSDLDGWVAPEVWARATALLAEASALLHEHNQAPRTEDTVHVSFTAWAFRMEP